MTKAKSQTSIEFMGYIAMLLVLFLVVASNSSFFTASMINTRTYAEGRKMSDSMAFEVNTAAKAGDGYRRSFFIGNNIFGVTDFAMAARNYEAIVDWKSGFASSPMVVKDVQGNFSKGWNTVSNSGGVIYVS